MCAVFIENSYTHMTKKQYICSPKTHKFLQINMIKWIE